MADRARTGSHVRGQAALADYTTLRLGGPARRLVEATTEAEIVAEVRAADERGEPLLVLGGGSNLVVADEGFGGTVVHVATSGVRHVIAGQDPARQGVSGPGVSGPGADAVELTVAGGEDWDSVVAACVGEELAGLECLSGIPGLAGATPIQNVGAYGQEVAERIISVRVYDRERGAVTDLAGADCGFGYRTSAFKRSVQTVPAPGEPAAVTGRFVVLSVRFLLVRDRLSAPVRYAELARALGVAEGGRAPLAAVRSAVLGLRRGKGMVLDPDDPDTRSVGSFFINPVLDRGHLATVERAAHAVLGPGARVPCHPAGDGRVKVSAAWLIEQAGFRKGYPAAGAGAGATGARISSKHTLALVNPGGATAASLLALAREVRAGVRETFGVELASEPVLVGTGL
jgi:UDP-N-acetylmuramate dehydrogenase